MLRLVAWRNLEREWVDEAERESFARKIAAIKASQKAGTVNPAIPAVDLMAILMGLITSWLAAPPALRELGDGAGPPSARRRRAHRQALMDAVARVVDP